MCRNYIDGTWTSSGRPGGAFSAAAPFGGFGQSEYGRELGVHGLEEFLEVKALLF